MREERCLLFVSHDSEAVKSLCSHALWISNGETQALGECKSVSLSYQQYCMAQTYGDEVSIKAIGQEKNIKYLSEDNNRESSSRASSLTRSDLFDYNCKANAVDNLSNADGWKTGDAELISVKIKDLSNNSDIWPLKGGEEIEIEIQAKFNKAMDSPAIGFTITNRLGQHLLGENTLVCRDKGEILRANQGDILSANFRLIFPMLPSGQYMLMASVANGTLNDNVQHHWTENATLIEVVSSRVRYGLVGCFLICAKIKKN